MGKKIVLKNHLGFLGGLKSRYSGLNSIYYANNSLEIIYHVSTLMPTSYDDEQQINKKKHIGNDHVTIVWSENYRDYRRYTISSQFNCVHIVIYPLKNNLFRVQVMKKNNVSLFPFFYFYSSIFKLKF